MNRTLKGICFLLIPALISSCKTAKPLVADEKPALEQNEAQELIRRLGKRNIAFDWVSGKIECSATLKGEKTDFTTNFRLKNDSLIWLSISPALGIEIARANLTQDNVMFVNKLQKQYFVGSYDYLLELLKIEDLNYCLIEEILLGRPILLDEEEKWKVEIENEFYVLKNVPSKSLRKGYGITKDENFAQPADSIYLYDEMGRKLIKAIKKNKDKDNYLKRYFLNSNYELVKMIVTDVSANRVMEIKYRNFQQVDLLILPTQVEVSITDSYESTKFELNYTKIKSETQSPPPFKIPENYAPIRP